MITKEELLNKLTEDLSEPNLQIFKNSVNVESSNDKVVLIVSDAYMKQWIENKCYSANIFICKLPIDDRGTGKRGGSCRNKPT